jgi:hypothetical protein
MEGRLVRAFSFREPLYRLARGGFCLGSGGRVGAAGRGGGGGGGGGGAGAGGSVSEMSSPP